MDKKEMDIYQERYIKHQGRKSNIIKNNVEDKLPQKKYSVDDIISFRSIIENRHSTRIFSKNRPSAFLIDEIIKIAKTSASSCNRQAVSDNIICISDPEKIKRLSDMLVGGKKMDASCAVCPIAICGHDGVQKPIGNRVYAIFGCWLGINNGLSRM